MTSSIVTKWAGAAVASALLLCGCTKVLDYRNADISNNKVYENGANSPFTGKLTNISVYKIPAGSVLQFIQIMSIASKDQTYQALLLTGAIAGVVSNGGAILCDVGVKEGQLNGDAICKLANLDMPLFKIPFKDGRLEGKALIYDLRVKEAVVAEIPYVNGERSGTSIVHSLKTGKVVHKAEWQGGQANGVEEMYDEHSGVVTFHGTLVAGRYDGEALTYDPGGKLIKKQIFKEGSILDTIDLSGNAPAAPATQPVAANETCPDQWMAAFRKENGEDATVSSEQMDEWEKWCKEGKKPDVSK